MTGPQTAKPPIETILGVARSYAELRALLVARRRALGLTQEALNDRAGLQGGYVNKLEVGIRSYGDMSLSAVLGALGVEIVLMAAVSRHAEEREGLSTVQRAALKKQHRTRQQKGGLAVATVRGVSHMRAIGLKGAKARWKRQMKGRRQERARAGAVTEELQERI